LYLWLENHEWKHLPYSGGVYDQPAWIWEKLMLIGYYKSEWDKEQKGKEEIKEKMAAISNVHAPEVDGDMAFLLSLPDNAKEGEA
jgi:hypothetical protein